MKQVPCLLSFLFLVAPAAQAGSLALEQPSCSTPNKRGPRSDASSRKPSQPPSSKTIARATDSRPVVAVFDIEDTRQAKEKLDSKKLRSLTDYLVNKLGVGGKFEIVPRANVRAALQAKKKESYNTCFDEACQIEIGKEIAAQKSLATKIDQMGGECIVTATLYDLRKGATENSASYRGPCGHSELLTAIEQIAFKLRGEKPSQASKKGIRFDTTALPEVPTLDMPSDADGASSGVDFGNVDVDSMEILDSAIQADKDHSLSVKDKIARWEAVKMKAPKYRKQATAKIVAWTQYERKRLEIEQIQKKRAAKMMQDWNKLARLLKLKMISDEDKKSWGNAFYDAYEVETRENPFARDPAVRAFLSVRTKQKEKAEAEKKRVAEERRRAEEQRRRAEEERRMAVEVQKSIVWVHSKPAGIDFTKSEITVAQYRACVAAGKCTKPMPKVAFKKCNWVYAERDKHPIDCVDFNQAKVFCEWAGGRLPTEHEWQAEASNKGSRKFPWGDEAPSCEKAIFTEDYRFPGCGRNSTWPVCSKTEGNSVSGLCDMVGNVMEWTSSWYDDRREGLVLRGAAYHVQPLSPWDFESSERGAPADAEPSLSFYGNGVRCVRSVE